MSYVRRVSVILAMAAALGAAGVFFGPHRDAALASIDDIVASLEFPAPLPGDAKVRPGVLGQNVNGAGLRIYLGTTDVTVDQLFDFYNDGFDVLHREEGPEGGSIAFMRRDAAEGVADVDGLAGRLFVLQATREPEASRTSFVLSMPEENFRLADFARTELGDSAEGDLPDVPRMPGAERVAFMDRTKLRSGGGQQMVVYKGPGDVRDAVSFYRESMPQYGWQLATAAVADDGFLFFQKGGRLAQITVSEKEGEDAVFASVSYSTAAGR